jgi:hypothetical protein
MSDPIGMSITIGGELPASLIKEFLDAIKDIGDLIGPSTEEELRAEISQNSYSIKSIQWQGITNFGYCEMVEAFCENHNLSYVHHTEAKYEYDADVRYWVPGMKAQTVVKSDQEGTIQIPAELIRPFTDLLLGLAKDGKKALPLFLHTDLKKFVTKGLKNYPKMLTELTATLNNLLPVAPTLPPLTIKEDA